ncbi:MAG: polysaccharide deacetylase family protein [Prosthecobacter sp.]
MTAAIRSRCLRVACLRLVISLLPLGMVAWLVWQGNGAAALLIFLVTMATMMTGMLMPRCSLFGPMIKRLPAGSDKVLLTVDDGPHPEHTPAFLDLFDRHGIKAVFFLIGDRAARHPELVREIVRRGHEIGNHTQSHPAGSFWSLSPARLWREIAGCQETLTRICPEHPPRFFRPPAGHHNLSTFVVVRYMGLRMMMWSARGFDGVRTDVGRIVARIRSRLEPGAIVVIHEATPVAVEVAEAVTQLLAESGLECRVAPSRLASGHD